MAYESKMEKGRKFQNHQEGKHFDKVRGEEKAAKSKPKESEGEDSEDIGQVVEAHGPAHESTIAKDGDEYTMKSLHKDGHKHSSKHGSAHEAHNASMMAHGESGGMGEGEQPAPPMPAMGGQSMPPGM